MAYLHRSEAQAPAKASSVSRLAREWVPWTGRASMHLARCDVHQTVDVDDAREHLALDHLAAPPIDVHLRPGPVEAMFAEEVAHLGIRVNAISAGPIKTLAAPVLFYLW